MIQHVHQCFFYSWGGPLNEFYQKLRGPKMHTGPPQPLDYQHLKQNVAAFVPINHYI